jgi:hypothetical protein
MATTGESKFMSQRKVGFPTAALESAILLM